MADIVSMSDDGLAQPQSWDLLSGAAVPSSNVVLTPSPPKPAPPKPVARRKPRRERRAADSDRLSRFFGGLICAFFGLVMLVGGGLLADHLRREHGVRWGFTSWLLRAGVATIVLGIGVTLSSLKK